MQCDKCTNKLTIPCYKLNDNYICADCLFKEVQKLATGDGLKVIRFESMKDLNASLQ